MAGLLESRRKVEVDLGGVNIDAVVLGSGALDQRALAANHRIFLVGSVAP